jgi:pimeloyl-ACP methyl ester carboxylesterase
MQVLSLPGKDAEGSVAVANLSPVPPLLQETRFPFELRSLRRSQIWRGEGIPRGHGEPVLLLPGFMAGDSSLSFMANWLKRVGYAPRRAGIRVNVDCSEKAVRALERRIEMIVSETDEPMRLIGHSRGGMFARVLAVRRPDLIAGVVTLGTPHLATMGDLHPVLQGQINVLCRIGNLGINVLSGRCRAGAPGQGDSSGCCEEFWVDQGAAFPRRVPFASIYSRSDGIVNWQACLDPSARQIKVSSSHCGMGVNPDVYAVVAAELARHARARRVAAPEPIRFAATG